ncbi:MAG: thioredoxin [Flavobacteriales bacterium]|nr:thioredoxin [Flavobacteriales bacterium]MCW8913035.1 thioredoxin [Flavobacteriales bacterium]MCW8938378.1 thioredoxin [Flavobacteriales bacterium]MCW8940070.1 thioredoxin [Flavobacteriales bacterium]MCW8967665.1 thioredoxin [Flavobacteriales bacterium]
MATFNEIINSDRPVLVDFFATWCGPCKVMSPILDDVAKQVQGKVRVLKIDVDKNQQAATAYQVRGVPTLILFKNGKQLWRQSGVVDANQLVQIINQHS